MTGSEGLTRRVRQHHATGAVVLSVRGVGRAATVAEIEGVTDDVPVVLANGDAHSGSFNGAALGLLGFSDATGRGPSSPLFAPKVDELTDQREHDPSSVSARFDQRDTRGFSGRPPSESGGP